MSYASEYARSVNLPEEFWLEAASQLEWYKAPQRAHDAASDRWFVNSQLNVCYNAVDRHVAAGRGGDTALLYESPVSETSRQYTFKQVQNEVAQTAGMLSDLGVGLGDRVVIYMPMVPEAVFAMLACARIGAIHSVVFGGFSAAELSKRINDCQPSVLLCASCGLEANRTIPYVPIVAEAMALSSGQTPKVVVLQRDQYRASIEGHGFLDWGAALKSAHPRDCVPVPGDHPLYILYTSGTTGKPKGVVRDSAGHCVALNWSMEKIYGLRSGETFWAASDIGWVVGHSYIVYGPLIAGCTTVLYEGKPIGTPDAGQFWRLIKQHDVSVLFTAPTAIRAIRGADPLGNQIAEHASGSLRTLFLAGERADPDTVRWIGKQLNVPVVDHWWQTELGWPALASCIGMDEPTAEIGSAGRAVPGFDFVIVDAEGNEVPDGSTGNLLIRQPLPPGAMIGLWDNEEGYRNYFATFAGTYATGDAASRTRDGAYTLMGRTDDIINVAGHRLSTGGIEEVVADCDDVVECAVVGAKDALKGQVPVVFFVGAPKGQDGEDTGQQIITMIRAKISPIASPRHVIHVEALPKTRSGKILRKVLRLILDGEDFETPQTIENESVVAYMIERVRSHVG